MIPYASFAYAIMILRIQGFTLAAFPAAQLAKSGDVQDK
jgi:hypothetical protein